MNKGLALFLILLLFIVGGTILLGTQQPPETQQSVNNAFSLVTVELNGTITQQVKVYTDQNATIPLTTIKWGTLSPGGTYNRIIYISNPTNSSWNLMVIPVDWIPIEVEQYINLTVANTTLEPEAINPVTFTLTVAEDVHDITKFNFNLILRVNP